VSIITTIGLYVPHNGNFQHMSALEAVNLIVMIIVSVGAGASILQSTMSSAIKGDLARGHVERQLIRRLKRHGIIFGYTQLGKYVAEKLREMKTEYVVVTKNEKVYRDLISNEVLAVLQRDSRAIEALREAGIARASVVIVCGQDDADNMLFILSARKLHPAVRIVAVANDEELVQTAKNAGADEVIPSSITVGHLLALSAVAKNLAGIVFSRGVEGKAKEEEEESAEEYQARISRGAQAEPEDVRYATEPGTTNGIVRIPVPIASPFIGKPLQDILPALPSGACLIGVTGGGKILHDSLSDPRFRLERGDALLALGEIPSLRQIEQNLETSRISRRLER
jgi:Trk K+ transport system NAD-binding subunit